MDQEILNYAKARYEEEQLRFEHVENKCSRLLSFLTICIAALTGIASYNNDTVLDRCGLMDWSIIIAGSAALICLFFAWAHALLSLRLVNAKVAPRNQDIIDYFNDVDAETAHQHIFNCYMDTTMRLVPIIDKKAQNLRKAYGGLTTGGGLIALVILLVFVQEFIK